MSSLYSQYFGLLPYAIGWGSSPSAMTSTKCGGFLFCCPASSWSSRQWLALDTLSFGFETAETELARISRNCLTSGCGVLNSSYTASICSDKDISPCQHGDLLAQVIRLQGRNAWQLATIRVLQKRLAEAQRARKRQAAPFSNGIRTAKPRRPGRNPGIGSFSFYNPPPLRSRRS